MTRAQLTDQEWEFIEPYLPIGGFGPYPQRLRWPFEGVVWRFRTGGQWREMPREFGAWSTVSNRFRQWRDAGVFDALLEGLIAEAGTRGAVRWTCRWSAWTPPPPGPITTLPGCTWDGDVITALEKAAAEEEGKARHKGAPRRNTTGRTPETTPGGKNAGAAGADTGSG